jgi:hypothetical protein
MRWLVTFLLGVLVGAGGLFVYLRGFADAPDPIVTDGGALPAPPADPPKASTADSPLVQTDLADADLPIRPAPQASTGAPAATKLSAVGNLPG